MTHESAGAVATLRPFAAAAYVVAALLILAPPLDIWFSMPVTDVSEARWRFGAVGLVTGAMLLPVAGFLLAMVTAVLCGHRRMFGAVMALGGAAVIALVLALGLFVLDAMEVRQGIAAGMIRRFDWTVVKSVITQLAQIGALSVVLWTGLRASRSRRKRVERGPEQEGVVVSSRR
jgi:hypothetical protein